jgi:hypothetical protein
VSYVMPILKYYKHGTTDNVSNHIRRVYREDGDYYEDDAHVMGVHHRVSEEIDHVGGGNTSTRTTSMRYTCRKMARNVCGHGDAANGGHPCSVVLGVE